MNESMWDELNKAEFFRSPVRELALRSVAAGFPIIRSASRGVTVDWDRAVFASSLVSPHAPEGLHDGALRIAQGCLQSLETSDAQKVAASAVLSRLGNSRAIGLAVDKSLLSSNPEERLPMPLQLDVLRRRLELEIDVETGPTDVIPVNPFQADFWARVQTPGWLSVSAPTSVGKSFIIRKWLEEQFAHNAKFTVVYVVPTRALIEEVSSDLLKEVHTADVFTLPWDDRIARSDRRILVLTQERLHILELKDPEFVPDFVFIDEAQKIGDGSRGVLLQRVLDELSRRSDGLKVVFASPLTSNPELLIAGAPGNSSVLTSELVTVNQNLIHVNQIWRKPLEWTCKVFIGGDPHQVGDFTLPNRANTDGKRLPLIAAALGGYEAGNVVYANTASEAEKIGEIIYDVLGDQADVSDDPAVSDLIDLVERTIHRSYRLRRQLSRGIAFHYGNMPLLVREAIESLFRQEKLRYLICTSTLLEGVNLPCKNLFVRAPRRGSGNPMTPGDFWNLAGRAGRWGIEFQGNIVCVDTERRETWTHVPTQRSRQPITRATDASLTSTVDFLSYVRNGTQLSESKANKGFESTFSYVASWIAQGRSLNDLGWLKVHPNQDELEAVVRTAIQPLTMSVSTRNRHAGVSPLSIQRLADYLQAQPDLGQFVIPLPESEEFVRTLQRVLPLIDFFLGGDFGNHPGHHTQLAILIERWVRGYPLSHLISNRVDFFVRDGRTASVSSVIRSVMNDIEQMVRFQAPLYLSCFRDVLAEVRSPSPEDEPEFDLTMMLELGVSRQTELSMISLGLSRTSVVALADFISADNLDPQASIDWMASVDIASLDVPALIRREVEAVLVRHQSLRLND